MRVARPSGSVRARPRRVGNRRGSSRTSASPSGRPRATGCGRRGSGTRRSPRTRPPSRAWGGSRWRRRSRHRARARSRPRSRTGRERSTRSCSAPSPARTRSTRTWRCSGRYLAPRQERPDDRAPRRLRAAPDRTELVAVALLIRGGRVLRGSEPGLEDADVLVEGERITAVAPRLGQPVTAEVLDARGLLVLPGLINAHTHAHNNLLRGLAGRWTLEDLLNHGPALNANRTAEDHYVSAAIGAVEMLKTGGTTAFASAWRRPFRRSAPTSSSRAARGLLGSTVGACTPTCRSRRRRRSPPTAAGVRQRWRALESSGSSVRGSSVLTGCGSPTTTSGVSPTPGARSLTTPRAISGSGAASRRCARCWTGV